MVTPRAVVLVGGPVAPYSRAIRIARALVDEGYTVEIAGIAAPGLPARESVAPAATDPGGVGGDGAVRPRAIVLRRYRPSGPWAVLGASDAATGARAHQATGSPTEASARGAAGGWRRRLRAIASPVFDLRRWLLWPHAVRGWWATLARELEPADLYHACGSLTVAAALSARRRHPAGPSGRPARVIYDSVDIVAESNAVTVMPPPIRGRIARMEGGWAAAADRIVTVNEAFAERLTARWHPRAPIVVVPNIPEPLGPEALERPPTLLREASHLPATTRIVVFQGRTGPDLGLEAAADAIIQVPDAALVILGFGRGMADARRRDADPRYVGRHVTLDAVPPDDVVAWIASADVCLIPLPPISANQRLTTPNKFWEAVVAGTPVVVVAGLTSIEALVREHDLGIVARSADAADLAAAIRAVVDRPVDERRAWRWRILEWASVEASWQARSRDYRALVRELSGGASGLVAGR